MPRTVLTILFFTLSIPLLGQWTRITTPVGNYDAKWIIQADSLTLLGTDHGIYQKSNYYEPWISFSEESFSKVILRKDTLILCPGHSDQLHYICLGENNNLATKTDLSYWNVEDMVSTDTVVYMASSCCGAVAAIRDLHQRESIRYLHQGLPQGIETPIYSLHIKNDGLYAGGRGKIYFSKIGEYNWQVLEGELLNWPVQILRQDNGVLFAVCTYGFKSQILYSTNNGRTFESFSPVTDHKITSFTSHDSKYYFSTRGGGVQYTTDFGESWNPLNTGFKDLEIRTVESLDKQLYCGSQLSGIYLLDDTIWQPDQRGIGSFQAEQIVVDEGSFYINTYDSIYISDLKTNWENITPITTDYRRWGKMIRMSDRLVVSGYQYNNNVNVSWDWDLFMLPDGDQWVQRNTPFNDNIMSYSRFLFGDGSRIYISYGENYYSDTQDWTWVNMGEGIWEYWMQLIDHVVYSAYSDRIARFKESPKQWEHLVSARDMVESAGLEWDGEEIGYFCSTNNTLFAFLSSGAIKESNGLYRSTNLGLSWTQVYQADDGIAWPYLSIRSHAGCDSTLAIVTKKCLLLTYDNGDHWEEIEYPSEARAFSAAAISRDTIFLSSLNIGYGGAQGIWKHPLKGINLGASDDTSTQISIRLYPNPASNYIIIGGTEPNLLCKLSIYVLTGKIIISSMVRADEPINIERVTSGLYMVQIKTGKNTSVQKLLITK